MHVALLGDKFKRDELSEFYSILSLSCDRVMSHGHLGHYNTLDSSSHLSGSAVLLLGGEGHHLGCAVRTEGCPLTADRSSKLNVTQTGASN